EEILGRLRVATADVTTQVGDRGEPPVIQVAATSSEETLVLFAENVADYRATVVRCSADGVADAVAEALARRGAGSVVVPDGLDASWVSRLHGALRVVADEGLTSAHLDEVDAVVTAARVGIATTGTIVLDHAEDQGRRALTLVPDQHVCVVRAEQV